MPQESSQVVFAAIQTGTATDFANLLAADPQLIKAKAPSGHSVWRFAADLGKTDHLDALRQREAPSDPFDFVALGDLDGLAAALGDQDVNKLSPSFDGWTLLHLAAFYGDARLVEWLLDRGARVDAVSENPMANQPLHAAIAGRQDDAVIELLLAASANPAAAAAHGVTTLHLAASRGNLALIERLLASGVDPAAVMDNGQTAADMARERGLSAAADRLG